MKKALLLATAFAIVTSAVAQSSEAISSIGKPLSKEVALHWMKNHNDQNPTGLKGYAYGVKAIGELLSASDVAGLYIFNSRDEQGTTHLIFKACDEKGGLVSTAAYDNGWPCPPGCKGNGPVRDIGGPIEEGLAQKWIENFQFHNPGRVTSYLYGKDILTALMAQKGVEGIYFGNGIDDQKNEHLILATVDKDGKILWDGMIAQFGGYCPPMCYNAQLPTSLVKK